MAKQDHRSEKIFDSAIVTLKGKPRYVRLAGIGLVRVNKASWRGHLQIEISRVTERPESR